MSLSAYKLPFVSWAGPDEAGGQFGFFVQRVHYITSAPAVGGRFVNIPAKKRLTFATVMLCYF
jgi:hypothetical protein